jgi:putative transposase
VQHVAQVVQPRRRFRLRDERLNAHSFPTIFHARAAAEQWRRDYNERRPHTTLDGMTPVEFIKSYLNQDAHFQPAI